MIPAPNSRAVRVFLSSTFRDFAEERDLLVRKVFPELRRTCRERQVELVDVDLRGPLWPRSAPGGGEAIQPAHRSQRRCSYTGRWRRAGWSRRGGVSSPRT